ncbi:MAG: DUF222 domain-containing protein [Gordonia sp. (in: high G+C Gram-positive bacteria)]|uniref:HNH endonuclease signature motif containing protein n=1 Tax=Gordonia sp. (in: high G+C Gram-positive bacteria) TaxID=84139 RepID=UPI0039E528AD
MNTTTAAADVPPVESAFPTPTTPRMAEMWAEFVANDALWQSRARAVPAAFAFGEPEMTVDVLANCGAAAAMLAWIEYREIGAMHAELLATGKPEASARGTRILDVDAQAAARIGMSRGITQRAAESWLADAITMRDRLVQVGTCLRDGTISPRQFRLIISRVELIDPWSADIDTAIADLLRGRTGTWSNKRLVDMVDRIVFRHDPDAVRRRHEKAKKSRSVWIAPGADGMATLGATMTAHDAQIALGGVHLLADTACPHDRRTASERRCDALFALLTGTPFTCDHATDTTEPCTATIPEPDALAAWVADRQNSAIAKGRVLVHVIADRATVDGQGDQPAFMDGHGVISAAHLRDLIDRDDTRVRPLAPTTNSTDAAVALPTHLPSDPYRPSTALDVFVRARDGYCTAPGCDQPASRCDLDHVAEYDHDHPERGGQTTPDGLAAKCRLHHLLKTFGEEWVDDQYRGPDGHLVSEVSTPEGVRCPGPAETNVELFPRLDEIRWHTPVRSGGAAGGRVPAELARSVYRDPAPRDRTKTKHARRRAERQANRAHRLAREWEAAEHEYHRRKTNPRATDGDPPF